MQQSSLPQSQWDSHHPLVHGKEKRRSLVTQGISQEAERNLWKPYPLLVDREYEALDQNTWEGRDWNFPSYLIRPDIMLYFKPEEGLVLTIFEPTNILEEDED